MANRKRNNGAETPQPIPIVSLPFATRSYKTPEAAIAAAQLHPLLPKAKKDAARFAGAVVEDVFWTEAEHVIVLSNGLYLHVEARDDPKHTGDIAWRVSDNKPDLKGEIETIGAPPVLIDWGPTEGVCPMDRSALAAKRLGTVAFDLWVGEGLFVYCRSNPVWRFSATLNGDSGRPMLYVDDSE